MNDHHIDNQNAEKIRRGREFTLATYGSLTFEPEAPKPGALRRIWAALR